MLYVNKPTEDGSIDMDDWNTYSTDSKSVAVDLYLRSVHKVPKRIYITFKNPVVNKGVPMVVMKKGIDYNKGDHNDIIKTNSNRKPESSSVWDC
jgi:hypothetical protein